MAEDTWASRDLVVLDAIFQLQAEQPVGSFPTMGEIAAACGLEVVDVWRSCRDMDGEYLDLRQVMAGGSAAPHRVMRLYPEARRAVGQWPSAEQYLERLIAALTVEAERASTAEERTRLRRAAESLGLLAKDVAVSVAGAALGGALS